jgi:DNA repair exonuclease SbcCD ATPase subunit
MQWIGQLEKLCRGRWWIGLAIGSLLATVAVISTIRPWERPADGLFYKQGLESLLQSTEAVQRLISEARATEQNLSRYRNELANLGGSCQELIEHNARLENQSNEKMKDGVGKAKQLCMDLMVVTEYALELSDSQHDYLLADQLPTSQKTDFHTLSDQLARLESVVKRTDFNLAQIDNSKMQDPALPELQALIKSSVESAEAVRQSLESHDYGEAREKSGRLNKSMSDNRQHLLTALSYFWKNTVNIEALRHSILQLQTQF